MASFSLTQILILALLFTVVSMVPQIDARARCHQTLDPNGCQLLTCRRKCLKMHRSMGGQCVQSGGTPFKPTYKCVCVFDCPLPRDGFTVGAVVADAPSEVA